MGSTGHRDGGRGEDDGLCVIGGNGDDIDGQSLELLTTTIRDNKWWGYAMMVHTLNGLSKAFTSWAEGCSCHGWLRPSKCAGLHNQKKQHSEEAMALEKCRRNLGFSAGEGDGVHFIPCPMAGLRAMELASGGINELFETLSQDYITTIMEVTADLGATDMHDILSDFSQGKGACMDNLAIKLQCWATPPWSFAAISHPDKNIALQVSRTIVEQFDASPQDPSLHHRKVWAHLSPDGVGTRAEFDLFNDGTRDLASLPLLRSLVWRARFAPTVERVQEADHSLVKRGQLHM